MSLGKISTLGERLDLELAQGATLQRVRHTLIDPDTLLPINLTGCVVRGQIRRKYLDPVVLANFSTAIAPAPADGWYEFWLSDEVTATLPCGPRISDEASTHQYDIELEDAAGDVIKTFYGTVRVQAEATRP